jgi:hypothetical protein
LPELPEVRGRPPLGKPEAAEWFVRMLDAPLRTEELVELGALAPARARGVAANQ